MSTRTIYPDHPARTGQTGMQPAAGDTRSDWYFDAQVSDQPLESQP
jgi:hypothetical protein